MERESMGLTSIFKMMFPKNSQPKCYICEESDGVLERVGRWKYAHRSMYKYCSETIKCSTCGQVGGTFKQFTSKKWIHIDCAAEAVKRLRRNHERK